MMKEKLHYILTAAFELGTSDIHITVGVPPVMRLNGELKHYGKERLNPSDTEAMAKAIIPPDLWDTFKEKGELDFSYSIPDVSRLSGQCLSSKSLRQSGDSGCANRNSNFGKITLPESLINIAEKPQGLVLVTGPTGSGKSTTLAAMIDYINKHMKRHIITLEDPIEYLHKHGLQHY